MKFQKICHRGAIAIALGNRLRHAAWAQTGRRRLALEHHSLFVGKRHTG